MAVANPAQEVGGWGGVAVPLARSLDLLLMTHQARVILYLPIYPDTELISSSPVQFTRSSGY